MDIVYKIAIGTSVLSFLAIVMMLYNVIRWGDELHGLFRTKSKPEEEEA